MNAGDVTALCAVATLAFTILCAVIKAIVDAAVNKAVRVQNEDQRKWLKTEFKLIRDWQEAHVKVNHGTTGVRRR